MNPLIRGSIVRHDSHCRIRRTVRMPNTSSAHTTFMTPNNWFPSGPANTCWARAKTVGVSLPGLLLHVNRVLVYVMLKIFSTPPPSPATNTSHSIAAAASLPSVRVYSRRQRARGRGDCLFSLRLRSSDIFSSRFSFVFTAATFCIFRSARLRLL